MKDHEIVIVIDHAHRQAQGLAEIGRARLVRGIARRRIEHLNGVLRAIRNVNQLITKEKDRYRLIRGACDCLTETHDCYNAWIALVDWEGKFKTMVEAFMEMVG